MILYTSTLEAGAPEPPVPTIAEQHRVYLSRIASRTLRDGFARRGIYDPSYVPADLESLSAEVLVRLRHRGYLIAVGVGGRAPIALATRDAAASAVQTVLDGDLLGSDQIGRLLVEIEVVGKATPFEVKGDWTAPGGVYPFVEPGVHGMVIRGPKAQHRFCPTEVFTGDVILSQALERLALDTHGGSSELAKVELMRFRTVHWYQSPGASDVVSLHRGLTLIPLSNVTRRGLDDAIAAIAEYLAYRQRDSGLFSYQYEMGRDRYTEDEDYLRQAGAALALAEHGRWSGKSASIGAADLSIRLFLKGLTEVKDVENGAFIATPDALNKLGVTALVCMTLNRHPNAERHEPVRQKLVHGMLWLQRPSGMFITAFPPAEKLTAQDYYPGEALLALALEYESQPRAEILEAFSRAIDFYRGYFRQRRLPALISWQMQAYALMARLTHRDDYAGYVFEMADWLETRQLNKTNCRYPEYWGGIAGRVPGHADISTAGFLEGLADAMTLARFRGDADRARRYEALVRQAARFVIQLQVRPEEAYFVPNPRDAVGGVRRTPTLGWLRINHSQHALTGLIKTRQALYGQED